MKENQHKTKKNTNLNEKDIEKYISLLQQDLETLLLQRNDLIKRLENTNGAIQYIGLKVDKLKKHLLDLQVEE